MSNPKFVLVTGATGKQGGSVVQALLEKGHQVRGLTRSVDSKGAEKLRQLGVDLDSGRSPLSIRA